MKINVCIIIVLFCTAALGQDGNGLYFDNLNNSKWFSDSIPYNANFFEINRVGLTLISENNNTSTDHRFHWTFSTQEVYITFDKDTLHILNYKKRNGGHNIVFQNSLDSVIFNYVSVSTGNYVALSREKIIEIIGEAGNSKDGAVIVSDGLVYKVENKDSWNEKHLGRKIKVKAIIINEEFLSESDLGYDTGVIKQGRLGTTTTIKIKSTIGILE